MLLDSGYDAVRISGSGELPPSGSGPPEAIDPDRLGGLGRAALRTLTALDEGPRPEHGPKSYVQAVSQVLPGWVLSLLAGTLLLPVLVASVDAFARARRRHVDVLRWLRWLGAWVAPFLAALAVAQFLALVDATPSPPAAPVPPDDLPLDGPALACSPASPWRWCSRSSSRAGSPRARTPSSARRPTSGPAWRSASPSPPASILLWLANPYAGLLAVPAAHLWMLLALTRPLPGPAGAGRADRGGRGAGADRGDLLHVRPVGRPAVRALVPAHARDRAERGAPVTSLIACVMLAALCATIETVAQVAGCPGVTFGRVAADNQGHTEVRGMTGRGVDPTLQTSVEQGQYQVDSHEVAEAIVRSWMLVAAESGHGAVRAEEDEAAAG